MPAQETGKFRAARIPLDYYKKPDLLRRWNRRLLVLAVLAALGATALGLIRADRGSGLVSRGPVAAMHATWDDKCDACHTPFRPVSGEAWLVPPNGWIGEPPPLPLTQPVYTLLSGVHTAQPSSPGAIRSTTRPRSVVPPELIEDTLSLAHLPLKPGSFGHSWA